MEKQPIIEDLPRFDISLLAGQALRVKVSNVASATKFHIQLPSATATEKAIHAYMAQRNPEVSLMNVDWWLNVLVICVISKFQLNANFPFIKKKGNVAKN